MIANLFLSMVLVGFTAGAPQKLSNNQLFQDNQIKFATQFMIERPKDSAGTIFSPIIADAGLTTLNLGMSSKSQCSNILSKFLNPNGIETRFSNSRSREGFFKTYDAINNSGIISSINNDLYHAKNLRIEDKFLTDIKKALLYKKHAIDFTNSKEATKIINDKISNNTNKLIKELFPQGVIKSDSQVVITNVLYLKADWGEAFKEEKTRKEPFTPLVGKAADITMMRGLMNVGYTYDEKLKATIITKKFLHPNLRMAFIQPENKTISLSNLMPQLKTYSSNLRGALTKDDTSEIFLTMPRMKIEQSLDMEDMLKATSLQCIKSEPLRNMVHGQSLYLSDMIHKVVLTATEKGSEGAAATGSIYDFKIAPTIVKLDRPFIFLIYDTETGGITFFGTYEHPVDFPLTKQN